MMTKDEVRELFDYDGVNLRWRKGRNAGAVAGTINKAGYRMVMIRRGFGKIYYAHRLIWLWVHGEWPRMIDHINMDKADNRLVNLRLATKSQNNANQRGWSKSGFKGVWKRDRGKPWAASIRKDGRTHHLGAYDTREQANEAYRVAAESMHGEFARA